jgi:hypothetical protein
MHDRLVSLLITPSILCVVILLLEHFSKKISIIPIITNSTIREEGLIDLKIEEVFYNMI